MSRRLLLLVGAIAVAAGCTRAPQQSSHERPEGATAATPVAAAATPEDVARLREALRSTDTDEGRRAATEAVANAGPAAVPALKQLVRDAEANIADPAGVLLGHAGPAAIPAIIELLKEKNSDLRARGAVAAYEMGPPAKLAIPQLVELLGDQEVWHHAVKALGKIGREAVPTLAEVLRTRGGAAHEPPQTPLEIEAQVRAEGLVSNASFALAEVGAPAVPALVELLAEKGTAQTAAWTLGQIGPNATEAVPGLAMLARRSDSDLSQGARQAAWESLGAIGPTAVPAVVKLLSDGDAYVREQAANTLAMIGPAAKAAVPELGKRLGDEHGGVRRIAAKALGRIGADASEAIPLLVKVVREKKGLDERPLGPASQPFGGLFDSGAVPMREETRKVAAAALRDIGPAAQPELLELLKGDDAEIRLAAIQALPVPGVENEAVSALIAALDDTDEKVRRQAIVALGRAGDAAKPAFPKLKGIFDAKGPFLFEAGRALGSIGPEGLPVLKEAARHPDELVRRAAASGLGNMRSHAKEVLPILLDMLRDEDWGVHWMAAPALGNLGREAAPAIPALRALLGSNESDVVNAARDALEKIEKESRAEGQSADEANGPRGPAAQSKK